MLGQNHTRSELSGATDNLSKHSYLMILIPKEKMGELTRQSPKVPCNLKYSVILSNACSGEDCVHGLQSNPCSPKPKGNVGSRNHLQSNGQADLFGKTAKSLTAKTKCRGIPRTCFPQGIRQQLSTKAGQEARLSFPSRLVPCNVAAEHGQSTEAGKRKPNQPGLH